MIKRFKVQLLDEMAMRRALARISFEIVEKCSDPTSLVIVGIKTRGVEKSTPLLFYSCI